MSIEYLVPYLYKGVSLTQTEYKPSDLAQTVKLGRYRHFKGGEYDVIGVGRSSEDKDQEFVVYKSLRNNTLWIRPLAMFIEYVEKPEYKYSGPRFQLIQS